MVAAWIRADTGVGPAIAAGRSRALDALRGGARGGARTQRLRAVLVTIEVAACVVLLVSSGTSTSMSSVRSSTAKRMGNKGARDRVGGRHGASDLGERG